MARFRRTAEPQGTRVTVTVDDRALSLPAGEMLAAALLAEGIDGFHSSVTADERRGPVCLMGSCYQCIVTIDGRPQVRACRTPVRDGMTVDLAAPRSGGG